jgi:chromate reductase
MLNEPITILGISGSLRHASYNRAMLIAAQDFLPIGVQLEIADLAGLSLFNEDLETHPSPALIGFKQKIRSADAILFSTPEYNYSIPGVLKNAIDCASRPYGDSAWFGKPVAVIGASIGRFGSARAQYHLRQTLVSLNMFPLNQPEVMVGYSAKAFDAQGRLVDTESQYLIGQLLQNLASFARLLKSQSAHL